MTQSEKALSAILAVLAVVVLFWVWLDGHDKTVAQRAQTEMRTQQLEQQNASLAGQLVQLKAANTLIQQQTDEKVAELTKQRQAASTPQDEVLYVSNASPLHPTLETVDAKPSIVLPAADLSPLADIIGNLKVSTVKLAGSEQANQNLEAQVAKLEEELKNAQEQISLLKKEKNSTSNAKFKIGFGLGFVSGFLIHHFGG